MQVASEQIVSIASRAGAPSVPALPLRGESPDLTALLRRPAWMADALCREYPNLSFLGDSQAAKRVCRRCLVREECRDYSIDNIEMIDGPDSARGGIWGGLSSSDRQRLRAGLPVAEAVAEVVTNRNGPVEFAAAPSLEPMEVMRCGEVCEALNVSPATVRAMADTGEIPWQRGCHGQRVYSRAAVEALREAR